MIKIIKKATKYVVKSSTTEKTVALKALFLSAFARFVILFIPFKRYTHLFGNHMQESPFEDSSEDIKKALEIAKVVSAISKHTWWDSKCLVQALAGKWLLKQQGISSTIYLGVQKTQTNTLKAHAWLRVGNNIVIGQGVHIYFKVVNYYS